jgi:hypothetical protein
MQNFQRSGSATTFVSRTVQTQGMVGLHSASNLHIPCHVIFSNGAKSSRSSSSWAEAWICCSLQSKHAQDHALCMPSVLKLEGEVQARELLQVSQKSGQNQPR